MKLAELLRVIGKARIQLWDGTTIEHMFVCANFTNKSTANLEQYRPYLNANVKSITASDLNHFVITVTRFTDGTSINANF